MNNNQIDAYMLQRLNEEVDLMQQAIDSYNRNKPDNYEKLINDCEVRIFNATVNLGNFDLAYNYAKTADDKKLLTRLMMSLIRKEDEKCKCTPDMLPNHTGYVEIPMFFIWRRIFDQRRGLWIDVYKCSKCNFMTTHPNSVATHAARNLERVRNSPESRSKNKLKDHEALR